MHKLYSAIRRRTPSGKFPTAALGFFRTVWPRARDFKIETKVCLSIFQDGSMLILTRAQNTIPVGMRYVKYKK
jgi:hypothetical protein